MNVTYFIAGSIFLALTIVVTIIKKRSKRKVEYDKAIKDIDEGIDNRDWDSIDDARLRMWRNK